MREGESAMPQTIESHRHHARILLATAAELK